MTRYNTDGSLDTTFGTGGIVTTTMPGADNEILALGLQGDGKLVAAGYQTALDSSWQYTLARYNTDGSLDTTFGTGGIVTASLGSYSWVWRLVIQADGKLLRRPAPSWTPTPIFGSSG